MPSKRKLRRQTSCDSVPVAVQSVTCIRGGVCKGWQVLQTEMHLDTECVRIGSRQAWLHVLLDGRNHESPFHGAIANFVSECVDAARLGGQGGPASSQAPLQDVGQGGPASCQDLSVAGPAVSNGRGAIFDEPDSESEGGDAASSQAVVATNKRRRPHGRVANQARRDGFSTISVRGMDITCAIRRGPKLLIPVASTSLGSIVEHLSHRSGEKARHSDVGFTDLVCDSDAGIIQWRPRQPGQASSQSSGSWVVSYVDQYGRTTKTQHGLAAPSVDLDGTLLTTAQTRAAAQKVLAKARAEWNRLDCSDRPRLQGPA